MAVDREVTWEKLAKMSAATLQHTPSQKYTVADRIEEKAETHAERPFIFYQEDRISYGELNAAANRMAHAALEAGLGHGDTVALMMENRPEFIMTWAGLAKLGVTTALINTNVRGRPLRHALETTGAKHLIVGSECLENVLSLGRDVARTWTVYVSRGREGAGAQVRPPEGALDLDEVLARMPNENPQRDVRANLIGGDDFFYIFTSGTTGLPKAARLSHMRFLGVGDAMSAVAGYGPQDVIYCVLPLYHGAGGMVVVSCALSQGAVIVLRRKFSASQFWDDARRYGVTACQYIGEICRYLLNQPRRENDRDHRLRVMMGAGLGGDIWADFQQRFGIERIIEGWSSTEANTSLINLDNRVGSCGRIPYKDRHNGRLIRYNIESESHPRNKDGSYLECAAGEVGEFIGMIPDLPESGAGRFEGYTSPEATEQKILRDVFQKGDQWYRSGDLLRYDEDGYFYFVDRIGDTYRWKSENVSTQEVAEALGRFPGLEIANVYGVKVAGTEGRAGMAALVLSDLDAFDGRAFYAYTEDRLPPYAVPIFVRLASAAEMTSTFKLRKVDLQREGYDLDLVRDPLFVRDTAAQAYVPLSAEKLAELAL